MEMVADYVRRRQPEIVVFEEARGALPGAQGGGDDSSDAGGLAALYPHRRYVHEMTGKDGASYGYWIGARRPPRRWIEDGFSFPGGVERKVLAAVWDDINGKKCLGVIGLHLSYQGGGVRRKEAAWLLGWLRRHEADCPSWLVLGDFNADAEDSEMRLLFGGGLKELYRERKPTVGAFNPIRRIYGDNVPSRTIDWALGWNADGEAEVVLDAPYGTGRGGVDAWVSDHAGVYVRMR